MVQDSDSSGRAPLGGVALGTQALSPSFESPFNYYCTLVITVFFFPCTSLFLPLPNIFHRAGAGLAEPPLPSRRSAVLTVHAMEVKRLVKHHSKPGSLMSQLVRLE